MIIDQLNATVSDNLTDEVPVEQGQLTYKTTWQKILALFTTSLQSVFQALLVSGTNIKTINSNSLLGSGDLEVGGDALYFQNIPCSAGAGNFASYYDADITTDHVLVSCVLDDPLYLTTDISWTTLAGNLVLMGTLTTATNCDVVLVKKSN